MGVKVGLTREGET